MRARLLASLAALGVLAACSNAGEKLTIQPPPNGAVGVTLYLDRDGTGTYTTDDTLFKGIRVSLMAAGGIDTIRVAITDSAGLAVFDSVPVGQYHVEVDRKVLGDSIGVVDGDIGTFRVLTRGDSAVVHRIVRAGFSEVSIAQARTLPAGRRVMIRGRVTSGMQFFHDTSAFVVDTSGSIRMTGALHRPGRTGDNVGDSVTVLGTTGTFLGQPVLVHGIFADVAIGAVPVATLISVAEAHTAKAGKLDAALVQILVSKITDTIPSGSDFIVRVLDPGDPTKTTDVLIDASLLAPHSIWGLGLTLNVKGVLVPKGDGTWYLKPRGGLDVILTP